MTPTTDRKAQIVYFSHGGGPLPILGDPGHKAMIDFMTALPARLQKPDLILVISAHWEDQVPTILGGENPPLFYDYYGFPEEAYNVTYPAQGSPKDALRIREMLQENDVALKIDAERGFDHGVFIPLKMMYPGADIPCLQLSLIRGLDAEKHLNLGNALRGLLAEKILVIGSGFSFHNMRAFSWGGEPREDVANDAFQDWLIESMTSDFNQEERENRMCEWEKAPSARYCHPREEHLLPVHVCLGMANKKAELIFDDLILGKRSVGFLW
jgi:aromatic ring-opening dioxygenase catalytic subunit (LigB family)